MRVLLSSVGGYGHLHPMLPLAQALKDAGHEVAIATGPQVRRRAEAAGFAAFDSGLAIPAAFARMAERFPGEPYNRLKPADILGWYLPHLFGEILAPAMLSDLKSLVQRWRPDVIVHDTWEFAAPIVAADVGIPSISHTLGLRLDDWLDSVAQAVAPLWRERGLQPAAAAGIYRTLCLDITPPGFQPHLREDAVRPLRPVAPPALAGECLPAWIFQRPDVPLVYMTLGTNTNSDVSMFRAVVDGLGDLDVDVLITAGFGNDPASIGTLPRNVHVEQYVAQSLLLPECDAVICHAGSGTTLGALALGLPLLVVPQGADQYITAELVRRAGVGVVLTPAQVNPRSVQANVLTLLEAPDHRTAARRLQREIECMPGPDEVVRTVEEICTQGIVVLTNSVLVRED